MILHCDLWNFLHTWNKSLLSYLQGKDYKKQFPIDAQWSIQIQILLEPHMLILCVLIEE